MPHGGFEMEVRAVAKRMEKFAPWSSAVKLGTAPLRLSMLHAPAAEAVRLLNNLLDISTTPHTQQGRPLLRQRRGDWHP